MTFDLPPTGVYILAGTGHRGARHYAKNFLFRVLFTLALALEEIQKLVYLDSIEERNCPRDFHYDSEIFKRLIIGLTGLGTRGIMDSMLDSQAPHSCALRRACLLLYFQLSSLGSSFLMSFWVFAGLLEGTEGHCVPSTQPRAWRISGVQQRACEMHGLRMSETLSWITTLENGILKGISDQLSASKVKDVLRIFQIVLQVIIPPLPLSQADVY